MSELDKVNDAIKQDIKEEKKEVTTPEVETQKAEAEVAEPQKLTTEERLDRIERLLLKEFCLTCERKLYTCKCMKGK